MSINLADIRPDGTGKYSKLVYLWCRNFTTKYQVHGLPEAWLSDSNGAYRADPEGAMKLHSGYTDRSFFWIGRPDREHSDPPFWFSGVRASDLANWNRKTNSKTVWATSMAEWIREVTPWFWKMYAEQGQCFLLGDLRHEWLKINSNSRKCAHCGKHERRHIKTVKRWERREVWT